MEIVVWKDFNDEAICGNVELTRGTELTTVTNESGERFVAFPDGRLITRLYSYNYIEHFSRNNDGKGLERGDLVEAIAFSPRERKHSTGYVFRFSEDELDMLREKWANYLMPYTDSLLFNNEFYDAPVEDLRSIAEALNIQIRRE